MDDYIKLTEKILNKAGRRQEIKLVKGDITSLEVDAIVNAAHEGLTGGGGVDGAIQKAGGPKLLGECLNLYGCPTGECRITGGYNLPAKYVIHTVGPVYSQSSDAVVQLNNKSLLKDCYVNCLKMAEMQGLRTIAFPCISTGAYCFPKKEAAEIAIKTITQFVNSSKRYLKEIFIVCFDDENHNTYEKYFKNGILNNYEDGLFRLFFNED